MNFGCCQLLRQLNSKITLMAALYVTIAWLLFSHSVVSPAEPLCFILRSDRTVYCTWGLSWTRHWNVGFSLMDWVVQESGILESLQQTLSHWGSCIIPSHSDGHLKRNSWIFKRSSTSTLPRGIHTWCLNGELRKSVYLHMDVLSRLWDKINSTCQFFFSAFNWISNIMITHLYAHIYAWSSYLLWIIYSHI